MSTLQFGGMGSYSTPEVMCGFRHFLTKSMANLGFHLADSVQVTKRFLFPEHLARHRPTEKEGSEQVNKPIHGKKKEN